MVIAIIVFGFLFGAILQFARLNKYDVISGLAMREDFTVAKAIAIAIGLGAILVNTEIAVGLASYHVKSFIWGGLILGGLIFGSGMAILGYCPGTLFVSLGEGALDALIGIFGGLTGGIVYTLILPSINIIQGSTWGTVSLNSLVGTNRLFFILLIIIGLVFIAISFWLQKIDRNKERKWIFSGIALAILNGIVFLKAFTNRPIGASTTYPYLADLLAGITHNDYFNKIKTPGNWELIFLSGAFAAGLIISLIKKDFKLTVLPENWKKHKGTSTINRIIWSFVGGFLLIMGARIAGGCTSGHILSGGMQLALSSLTFAVFVFSGLLITGNIFYREKK